VQQTTHRNFALSLNFVRRTINEQALNGRFQASSVTAIIGFGAVPSPGFMRKS
jgi:hypothetical protein